jgi:hypothetical protein
VGHRVCVEDTEKRKVYAFCVTALFSKYEVCLSDPCLRDCGMKVHKVHELSSQELKLVVNI